MIKHNIAHTVVSPYNPIVSLHPQLRQRVNDEFLFPIVDSFFSDRGGIDEYEALDSDFLRTEIEFNQKDTETQSFVQSHIYAQVVEEIAKSKEGQIKFSPRYVVTFDADLTLGAPRSGSRYPYKRIFKNDEFDEPTIPHGALKIGGGVVLYYIYIDLQELIRFLKQLPSTSRNDPHSIPKVVESQEQIRNRRLDEVIRGKLIELKDTGRQSIQKDIERLNRLKSLKLEGKYGQFRVNLAWCTTDDLDLHIHTPGGEIKYDNKTVEYHETTAELDVDANSGNHLSSTPQENVVWDHLPVGIHKISVEVYKVNESQGRNIHFTLSILSKIGEGRVYDAFITGEKSRKEIAEFSFEKGQIHIKDLLNS